MSCAHSNPRILRGIRWCMWCGGIFDTFTDSWILPKGGDAAIADTATGGVARSTSEDAAPPIKLREAANSLDTFETDACCSKYLARALQFDLRLGGEWTCPKCGELWKRRQVDGVGVWGPAPLIAVFGGRPT